MKPIKVFVLIHNFSNGSQVEVFKTMKEAVRFEREIIADYEKEDGRTYADTWELNEEHPDTDITIEQTELR
jgi:hypothetical protein